MRKDILKTLTFAVLHFAVGFGVSYAFTGSLVIAGGIALVEPLANAIVFYFHERAWKRRPSGPRRSVTLPGSTGLQAGC